MAALARACFVVVLLVIVVASYRQTLYAYPNGGGAYIVSRENLGTNPSLVAAASLLVDYTLTVSVSVAAGVAAITSAISPLRGYEVASRSSFSRSSRWRTFAARGSQAGSSRPRRTSTWRS